MEFKFLLSKYGLLIIAMLGMVVHFLKRKVTGESADEIVAYFRTHFKTLIISLVSVWIGWIGYASLLATGQIADVFAVFGIGYMCDSIFNRYDKQDG